MALALGAIVLAACGDDPPPPVTATGAGGQHYDLDNVCELLAARLCAAREPCCQAIGAPYDEARCVARQEQGCRDAIAAVEAGSIEFDPTHIDACIEDFEHLMARCFLSPAELVFELADSFAVCTFFRGRRVPGDACQVDVECAGPSGHGFAACDDDTGVCEQAYVVGLGETCSPAAARYCAPGLYCALMAGDPPAGLCEQALRLGDPCDPIDAPLACGNGRYCDGATLVCAEAKASETPCAGDLECDSLLCLDEVCAPLTPLVDPSQCGG
jgi:hypothetical protein